MYHHHTSLENQEVRVEILESGGKVWSHAQQLIFTYMLHVFGTYAECFPKEYTVKFEASVSGGRSHVKRVGCSLSLLGVKIMKIMHNFWGHCLGRNANIYFSHQDIYTVTDEEINKYILEVK